MSDYTLTQREHTNLKTRLTRAINTKDADKVKAEVAHALTIFEQKGFPDDWHRWLSARDDALTAAELAKPFNWRW